MRRRSPIYGDDEAVSTASRSPVRSERSDRDDRPIRGRKVESYAKGLAPGQKRFFPTDSPRNHLKRWSDSSEIKDAPVKDSEIRDGIIFMEDHFVQFLRFFIKTVSMQTYKTVLDKFIVIEEIVTKTTPAERSCIILPHAVPASQRDSLVHCYTTAFGVPPSVFFGSGFGTNPSEAKSAAGKDFVDRLLRYGIISSGMHTLVGENRRYPRENPKKFPMFFESASALKFFLANIYKEKFPEDIANARMVSEETMNYLEKALREVMLEASLDGPNKRIARNEALDFTGLQRTTIPEFVDPYALAMRPPNPQLASRIAASNPAVRPTTPEPSIDVIDGVPTRDKAIRELQKVDELTRLLEEGILELHERGLAAALQHIFNTTEFRVLANLGDDVFEMSVFKRGLLLTNLSKLLDIVYEETRFASRRR